jgi:hypothetical protein
MVAAVHQPNYLPWLGYFHKIAQSDVFVLLDCVQYPRGQSVANRNKIKAAQGVQYLTVPVSIPKGRKGKVCYMEVETADMQWKARHLKSLQLNYGRAPYFKQYFDDLASLLAEDRSFVERNVALIRYFAQQLSIATPMIRLSEMALEPDRKSELIVNICCHLGANVYLSGQGARKYNDDGLFAAHGVELVYQQFACPTYPQLHGSFVPNLSIVDLLFNCGPDSRSILEKG